MCTRRGGRCHPREGSQEGASGEDEANVLGRLRGQTWEERTESISRKGNAMGKFSAGKTSASPSGNEEEVWHGCICGLSSKSRLEKKDVLSASVLAMVKMNA